MDNMDVVSNSTLQRQAVLDTLYEENAEDSWMASAGTSSFYSIQESFQEELALQPNSARARMGHQINDMLLSCSFNGKKCIARNFTRVQSSVFGNCYTLQNSRFISRASGPSYGLELTMYLETDEYIPGIANSKGMQVVIHDQGTVPFPDEDGLGVMSGSETMISLRRIQVSRMGHPFGDCTPIEQFKVKYGVKYTRSTCLKVCQELRIRSVCDCFNSKSLEISRLLKTPNTTRPCRSDTEVLCQMRVARQFDSESSACGCHSPCSETAFEKTVSSRLWPNPAFASLLKATVCQQNSSRCSNLQDKNQQLLRNEFIKLSVYYEDLNYESLEESADYEVDQFVSDVGGTIGLWIGLSVLSVFEIFHLIYDIMTYVFCTRLRRNNPQQRYSEGR